MVLSVRRNRSDDLRYACVVTSDAEYWSDNKSHLVREWRLITRHGEVVEYAEDLGVQTKD